MTPFCGRRKLRKEKTDFFISPGIGVPAISTMRRVKSQAMTVSVGAAMALWMGAETRQVEDCHVGHEGRKLGTVRADQQVADEQRVPGQLGITRPDGVRCIGAALESWT